MSRYPGMPVEMSGSNEFFSDANLDLRGAPASYADFGVLPGQDATAALAESGVLQAHVAAGGALTPITLADVEVDDGSVDLGSSEFYDGGRAGSSPQSYMPQSFAPAAPAELSASSLDRIAELVAAKIERKLLGDQ